MKRLILLATILFVVSSSYGANKMSMVTYFPVPYVAYSQVSADQQLDVGLTSACNMNLGCSESDVNLKAHTVNLQKGKLELNNGRGVFGQSISLGNGNGSGQIRFNNVRMKGGEMQSLNAESMNVRSLELFGKPFPACKGKGNSDGQMKWQELALQGYSGTDSNGELYLVCGPLAASAPAPCCTSDQLSKGKQCNTSTNTCECPSGKTENSSGYCVDACTPSKDSDYYEISAEEAEEKMAHKTPCTSSWRGNPYKYSCRAGESRICSDAYQVGTEAKFISGSGSLIPNTSTPCSQGIIFPTSYNGETLLGWERIGEHDSPNCSYYARSYKVGLMGVYTCKDSGFGRYEWKIRGYCRKAYKYKYIDRKVCCP